jgi:hypothetical protein
LAGSSLPPITRVSRANTHRLIPSRYPAVGILDEVASPEDLELIWELEGWTNDRIEGELGIIRTIPRDEWVTGQPLASVIMAAFCHPHAEGSRFNDGTRGAWYCALSLKTAHAEAIFHRTLELQEVGVFDTFLEMREYRAGFSTDFHDIRKGGPRFARCYSPTNYATAQKLGGILVRNNSNGIVYRSVREATGTCLVCFRPRLVTDLRMGAHFEYRWSGGRTPEIRVSTGEKIPREVAG